MKLKYLLVFNAVVGLVYGIPFVLVPATVLSLYGLTPSPALSLAGQFLGVELIAVGLLTWFARDVSDSAALRAIMLALLIADVIGIIVAALGTLSGVVNALGWVVAVLYLLLAAGYTYFQFMRPSAS